MAKWTGPCVGAAEGMQQEDVHPRRETHMKRCRGSIYALRIGLSYIYELAGMRCVIFKNQTLPHLRIAGGLVYGIGSSMIPRELGIPVHTAARTPHLAGSRVSSLAPRALPYTHTTSEVSAKSPIRGAKISQGIIIFGTQSIVRKTASVIRRVPPGRHSY